MESSSFRCQRTLEIDQPLIFWNGIGIIVTGDSISPSWLTTKEFLSELLAGKGTHRDADGTPKTAGIFIGPEFGTVTRVDLVEAARECADAGFNVLISCAFNYEAQSTEFDKLGPIPVLKARMNADLHMQQDLANSGKGNLFVIFGEPDIDILDATGPDGQPN